MCWMSTSRENGSDGLDFRAEIMRENFITYEITYTCRTSVGCTYYLVVFIGTYRCVALLPGRGVGRTDWLPHRPLARRHQKQKKDEMLQYCWNIIFLPPLCLVGLVPVICFAFKPARLYQVYDLCLSTCMCVCAQFRTQRVRCWHCCRFVYPFMSPSAS